MSTGSQLKWPNDLLVHGKKLGGILIELRAESTGPACVVIGIGLNVALGDELLNEIAVTGITATDLNNSGLAGDLAQRGGRRAADRLRAGPHRVRARGAQAVSG